MNIIIYYNNYYHKIFILDSWFNRDTVNRGLEDTAAGAGLQDQCDVQNVDVERALAVLEAEADHARTGKGKYKRGTSRARVVNVGARRHVLSTRAKKLGMAHESMKTKNIMAPVEVILLILY